MDYISRIRDVERRARVVNLTLHRVCRRAGVPYHSVGRWLNGSVNPTVRTIDRDVIKLEQAIALLEDDLLHRLALSRAERARLPAATGG